MPGETKIGSHGVPYDRRLQLSRNVFFDVFGQQTSAEWADTLVMSLTQPSISGVEFPTFPTPEFQTNLHGHSAEPSIREALTFYDFVAVNGLAGPGSPAFGQGYLLDFGAGWGRITRLFMRDFPLKHIIGFEPEGTFCAVARAHNPFVSFVTGDFLPPTILAAGQFDLAVGWSIMSHLSEVSTTAWLLEFSRILTKGGTVVLTTWGLRFLERLKREQQMVREGKEIHFYSQVCINAAGDLDDRIAEYNDDRFVWFDTHGSPLYGEAFLSERVLKRLLASNEIPLSLEVFDTTTLAQDAFILKRL